MSEQWLRCVVAEGVFSDESVIVLTTLAGEKVSAFVPSDAVERIDEQAGRVKVRVFEDKGKRWAVLPDATSTLITIADEDLVPA